jgi:hypothetical protein
MLLHKRDRVTPVIPRVIVASNEPVSVLAQRYNVRPREATCLWRMTEQGAPVLCRSKRQVRSERPQPFGRLAQGLYDKDTRLLTDNGKECTDRLFASRRRKPSGNLEFDVLCHDLDDPTTLAASQRDVRAL